MLFHKLLKLHVLYPNHRGVWACFCENILNLSNFKEFPALRCCDHATTSCWLCYLCHKTATVIPEPANTCAGKGITALPSQAYPGQLRASYLKYRQQGNQPPGNISLPVLAPKPVLLQLRAAVLQPLDCTTTSASRVGHR